ncbi:hypothetical protein DEJ39_07625 [Bacteroidetes bacterium SCGC AAA795-G10]|nr:hypothetical protein DEJ39_07625 [Bacteroidetes bacterium SCGC AAA795-G10]
MGFFNFNKKKKFVSKLSIDQQDEILITLILMKQMIDADGIEKPEEKEYLKNYLLNCGITSKEELESILDSAAKLTSEQYDLIISSFDEFQKLTILQELYEIICSDNEINHDEVVLLFRISRDMGIDDDLVVDKFGANKDLLEKYIKTNKVSDSISKKFEDYQNQAKTDLEDIKSKIQEARDIRQKLIDNKLTIRITYGGLWEAEFQFNEAFKNYGESSEFQKHSMIYNKETEPFDYSDLENSDIKAFNKSFSNNKNLKTYSGEIEICEVLKIPKENIIMMLDEYISNPNDEISYEYTSWEDFLTQDWDYPEFSDTDIDDCTLGYNGPRIADCLLGLKQGFAGGNVFHYIQKVWENEKEDKIELKELNDLKDIDNILDFTDVRKLIIQLKENKTPIKLRSIWRNFFYFQFKSDEIDEFKNESDVPALDYYTERYGSAEHYDKNKSLHANWISYIEEIEIDYNEFLKRSFIEDYIESCEKNINVDDYYSTELNFSFEDYINWTTEEDLFFDGVAPGWLKSPKKDLIAPPKHNEDDLTKIYELDYKYFDEVINFCYAEVDIKDQSHVFVFDEGKFRKNEIIVSSNKKLRDELNKFKLTEIKSFSVDILFDKWTFFEEINYRGNFKGFDFTLNGGTAIKWSKHKGCYKNELDSFLKNIKNKEISELDFHGLNYDCDDSDEDYDYNFYNKIIWDENTPEEIIKDVEKNYSENEYEKLRDEIELEEDFLEIELFQKQGFINQIDINISFENETKNLKWIKKEDDSKEEIPKNAKKNK